MTRNVSKPKRSDNTNIRISIAGFACSFSLPVSFAKSIKRRYGKFIFRGRSHAKIEVHLLKEKIRGRTDRPIVYRKGTALIIQRFDINFTYNQKSRTGQLHILRNRYSFDSFLRIFYSSLLVRRHGLLVHAAGIIIRRKGYAFTGVSGSGKSTVARLLKSQTVLSDEIVAIVRKQKRYYLYGTPFWGELKGKGRNISAPLVCIGFLHQGRSFRLREVHLTNAIIEFVRCVLFFEQPPAHAHRLFDACERLIRSIKPQRITFPNTREFAREFLKGHVT